MSSIIDWLAHVGKVATGQNPQPGSVTLGQPQMNAPVTGVGDGAQFLQDPALFQWLQSQGAQIQPSEMVPSANATQEYLNGGYVNAGGPVPPGREVHMADVSPFDASDAAAAGPDFDRWLPHTRTPLFKMGKK